ncbi:hypothetical protein, partial [Alteromonas flava]
MEKALITLPLRIICLFLGVYLAMDLLGAIESGVISGKSEAFLDSDPFRFWLLFTVKSCALIVVAWFFI